MAAPTQEPAMAVARVDSRNRWVADAGEGGKCMPATITGTGRARVS
jgi:hypothetical protein